MDYYLTNHMPAAMAVFKQYGILSAQVFRYVGSGDGGAPSLKVMTVVKFPSRAEYEAVMKDPAVPTLMEDVRNFAKETPEFILGEVAAELTV